MKLEIRDNEALLACQTISCSPSLCPNEGRHSFLSLVCLFPHLKPESITIHLKKLQNGQIGMPHLLSQIFYFIITFCYSYKVRKNNEKAHEHMRTEDEHGVILQIIS